MDRLSADIARVPYLDQLRRAGKYPCPREHLRRLLRHHLHEEGRIATSQVGTTALFWGRVWFDDEAESCLRVSELRMPEGDGFLKEMKDKQFKLGKLSRAPHPRSALQSVSLPLGRSARDVKGQEAYATKGDGAGREGGQPRPDRSALGEEKHTVLAEYQGKLPVVGHYFAIYLTCANVVWQIGQRTHEPGHVSRDTPRKCACVLSLKYCVTPTGSRFCSTITPLSGLGGPLSIECTERLGSRTRKAISLGTLRSIVVLSHVHF